MEREKLEFGKIYYIWIAKRLIVIPVVIIGFDQDSFFAISVEPERRGFSDKESLSKTHEVHVVSEKELFATQDEAMEDLSSYIKANSDSLIDKAKNAMRFGFDGKIFDLL